MLESVIAAVAGPDGVEAYVAAMLQDRYKRAQHAEIAARRQRCEDCQLKRPSFGLPAEGRTRWCPGCAKAHAGAVNVSDGRNSSSNNSSNNASGRGTSQRLSAAAAAAAAADNAPAPVLIGAKAEKGGPARVAWRLRQAEADRLQLRLDRMVL